MNKGRRQTFPYVKVYQKNLYIALFRQWYSQWELDHRNRTEATKSDSHSCETFCMTEFQLCENADKHTCVSFLMLEK